VTTLVNPPTATPATAITSTGFTANWSAVSGTTSYRLDVSTTSTFATCLTGYQDLNVGAVTSYAVAGLTANTNYYYRVRAVNAGGASANPTRRPLTPLTTLPTAPTATAATAITSTGFTANWSVVSEATSYRLDVSTSSTFATY